MLHLMIDRTQRMDSLVNGVLTYSRIGRLEAKAVDVDVERAVRDAVESILPPAHIQVNIELPLPVVTCDATRLFQVFQNLIGNAVKFMDKPQGQVTIGCDDDGKFWQFSVADNGPSIEARHHERIFHIFQTLTAPDESQNTGIGLTLVKKIVTFYGGTVWVDSTVGKGSTFFFTFPKS